jgi:hypothetical protein
MRDTLLRGGIASVAGALGVGLFLLLPGAANASDDPVISKREEQASILVTADDDDDDSRDGTNDRSRVSRETGFSGVNSRVSRDGTNSRVTPVSKDRDRSRGDLTKDWTRDRGGDRTRDWTKNSTNDRSRHDTRGRR